MKNSLEILEYKFKILIILDVNQKGLIITKTLDFI